MEDEKIIELFFARSNDAVMELDRKYGMSMIKVAKNILKNSEDAQECLNDAYLGIWRAIPPARPSPLSAFVHKIIRNIAIKRYRKNTAQMRDERQNISLEEIADVYWYFDSVTDIAKRIDMTDASVYLRLDRMKKRLYKHLVEKGVMK